MPSDSHSAGGGTGGTTANPRRYNSRMSYTTEFRGTFDLNKTLAPEHMEILKELATTERIPGEGGKPLREGGSGRPCVYCQWIPTDDGEGIEWDGGEKFYSWLEWLQHIVEHHLKPWGYILSGEVRWRGADFEDAGVIYVKDNMIEAIEDVNPGPSWKRQSIQ
jgi:hypothetical protein